MLYEEKTMKSDKVYEGKILNLKVDTVEMPDKKYSKREIIEHSGGVAMIALTSNDSLILVKQYRKAVEDFLIELPAGKLELNEEPRETAIRELKEEIGMESNKLTYLSEFYTSPGYCNEKIHLFLAEDLKKGDFEQEEGEFLEVLEFNIDELVKMVKMGDIIDSKTIIGIFIAKEIIEGR
ncbi:MAG: NUDIX hydrolase [Tissierella sp.]|uniref:NUDIX hydrolase n=1 Tax=Tissierella sp. TaxID=41274 RepID=UPI003F9E55D7